MIDIPTPCIQCGHPIKDHLIDSGNPGNKLGCTHPACKCWMSRAAVESILNPEPPIRFKKTETTDMKFGGGEVTGLTNFPLRHTVTEHEGKKYLRGIRPAVPQVPNGPFLIDVYSVLTAFGVTKAPIAHAIKKLLMPGQRGKGGYIADLKGVLAAVNRAIDEAEAEQKEIADAATCVLKELLQDEKGSVATS